MFSDEIVIRRLDLRQASRNIAMRAVHDVTCISGWMKDGVRLVEGGNA